MRRILWFALVGIVAFSTVACHDVRDRITGISSTCPHDRELRTYQLWRQAVTFPYTAQEAKLRRIKDNYSNVGVGSSKKEILNAFGPPDFEHEINPKEPWRPCVGYQFMYYFEKPDEMVNEFKDKNIQVFFTPSGKVSWIVGNVGLAEKGGYARQP